MEYKGRTVRPLWQIAVLLPIYPFYLIAKLIVDGTEWLGDHM